MFRLAFNSNLVANNYTLSLEELDPDTVRNDHAFPKSFRVTFFMDEIDVDCNSIELEKQKTGYKIIEDSIEYRKSNVKDNIHTQVNLFGDPDFDDRDEIMVFDPNNEEASELSGEEA